MKVKMTTLSNLDPRNPNAKTLFNFYDSLEEVPVSSLAKGLEEKVDRPSRSKRNRTLGKKK